MGCTLKYTPKSIMKIQNKRSGKATGKSLVAKDKLTRNTAGPNGGPIQIVDQQILEIDGEFVKITMLGRF